jgi:hypothetical protein
MGHSSHAFFLGEKRKRGAGICKCNMIVGTFNNMKGFDTFAFELLEF